MEKFLLKLAHTLAELVWSDKINVDNTTEFISDFLVHFGMIEISGNLETQVSLFLS